MNYFIVIMLLLAAAGCAISPLALKQKNVLECVTTLHGEDVKPNDSFEICRQVYRLEKIQ